MKKYFNKLPKELKKVVTQISKVSQETHLPAYLVGGCLRDLILGVKNLDLDIAIEGSGIIFAKNLAQRLKASLVIHQRFGTATLILSNSLKVDVASTRQEKYPYSAALPLVSPGSIQQDLKRRDFTINALAITLTIGKKQEIIDPYGGQHDLVSGKIRFLHNLSFKDDPTRILRAVRFSQRFGFKIESKTLIMLKEAISDGLLVTVSPHRMRDELILILKEQNPFKPLKELSNLGALSFISTKLKIGRSTQVFFALLDKQIAWFAKNVKMPRPLDNWLVYFAGLLEPLNFLEIKVIMHRFGLRKTEVQRLTSYYQWRDKLVSVLSKKQLKPEQIFSLLQPLSYETIILLSVITKNKNFKKHMLAFFKIYHGMRLCISGDDLIKLGVLPGPKYQKIFAEVLAAKLNGQVKNRQTELALVKRLVKR